MGIIKKQFIVHGLAHPFGTFNLIYLLLLLLHVYLGNKRVFFIDWWYAIIQFIRYYSGLKNGHARQIKCPTWPIDEQEHVNSTAVISIWVTWMGLHSARWTTFPSRACLSGIGTVASGSPATWEKTAKVWPRTVLTTNLCSRGIVSSFGPAGVLETSFSSKVKLTAGLRPALRAIFSFPKFAGASHDSHRSAMYFGTLTNQTPRFALVKSKSLSDGFFSLLGVPLVAVLLSLIVDEMIYKTS